MTTALVLASYAGILGIAYRFAVEGFWFISAVLTGGVVFGCLVTDWRTSWSD